MHPGVSRVGPEVSAPWFLNSLLFILLRASLIFRNYQIGIFKSIFASRCLEVRSWSLSIMIFGFPIVDIDESYLDIPKLKNRNFSIIFGSWCLQGRTLRSAPWFLDSTLLIWLIATWIFRNYQIGILNQFLHTGVPRVGPEAPPQ